MNKIAVYIVSMSILLQSFNFVPADFGKLTTLLTHLTSHIESGDSVISFVELHYGSLAENHRSEHKEHQELPFNHEQFDGHIQLSLIVGTNLAVNLEENNYRKNIFSYREPSTNLYINSFFQPPQS